MADAKITQLNELTVPINEDLLAVVDDPSGSPETKKIALINLLKLGAPVGYMLNGKLDVSVATNDLTVAIKTLAGNNPSVSDPVFVRIGNTVRTITAAITKTLLDGTNWFNAGASETATKEVDYFVYLIWNTTPGTDIVDLGFARISHGNIYSDFSSTSTDENYLATANASAPQATNELEVIGRFNSIISAGAGFTWSAPATSIIINRPIFNTRWLTWSPIYGASGGTFTSVTTRMSKYHIEANGMKFVQTANGTTGSTPDWIEFTLPFTPLENASNETGGASAIFDGAWSPATWEVIAATKNVKVVKISQVTFTDGSSRFIKLQGFFEIA